MQCVDFFVTQGAGFVFQQDGDAVANGVGQAGAAADELAFIAIQRERALGDGADEQFEEFGVHGHFTSMIGVMIAFRAGLR